LFRGLDRATTLRSELTAVKGRASVNSLKITAAEQRVLALVARARTNKEIALDLSISPATVKRHMEKILRKLGLRNRVEAAIRGLMLHGCPHDSSFGCIFRTMQSGGRDELSRGPIAP
jgi:DNA-binding NarL/FixJ family response regulator